MGTEANGDRKLAATQAPRPKTECPVFPREAGTAPKFDIRARAGDLRRKPLSSAARNYGLCGFGQRGRLVKLHVMVSVILPICLTR